MNRDEEMKALNSYIQLLKSEAMLNDSDFSLLHHFAKAIQEIDAIKGFRFMTINEDWLLVEVLSDTVIFRASYNYTARLTIQFRLSASKPYVMDYRIRSAKSSYIGAVTTSEAEEHAISVLEEIVKRLSIIREEKQ